MTKRVPALVLCMLAAPVWAGSKAGQKQLAARLEAQDAVDAILKGEGNLNATLSRVQYLGQEGNVCFELNEVARRSGDDQQTRRIAQALATLAHPNGEPGLVWMLGHEDSVVRMYAAQGLGRMKSQNAGARVQALLGDKSLGVRKEAAKALGLMRYAKAGGALMKAAKVEGEIDVRAEMLVAVGAVGDKKQAAGLESFLDDSSESARFAAAQGLCLLGNKKGFDFAKKKLASADRYERIDGLKLFEGARAKDVSSVLAPMVEDKDRAVAAMAARILYQGGDAKMLDWLVLKSFQSNGDEKLAYEKELELLRLADDQRKSILAKAGIK